MQVEFVEGGWARKWGMKRIGEWVINALESLGKGAGRGNMEWKAFKEWGNGEQQVSMYRVGSTLNILKRIIPTPGTFLTPLIFSMNALFVSILTCFNKIINMTINLT